MLKAAKRGGDFAVMAAKAGPRMVRTWVDPDRWFAVQMLERI